ncbi:flagellar assembly protein FliW [bacterium AH-315-J21]|nr:flagellar assembly protein FliW [bacterium AH-315-J21]
MSKEQEQTRSKNPVRQDGVHATLKVTTTRFGELNVTLDKVIELEKPVLGFEAHSRFILVEHEEMAPFVWLQAIDEPELAFLMINPTLFFPDYSIEVNPKEVEDIGVVDGSEVETYAIVTVPNDAKKMTANLQGPIVINMFTKQAKQLVLANSRHSVREPLFNESSSNSSSIDTAKKKQTANV